jgi:methyl-accepting chemotaxis protein
MRDLVEIDARAIDLASTVRVELLAAIRSEKNAVLTSDDTESAAFAQDARAAAEQVNQILLELNPLVRDESLAIVRQDVEEFSRDWERFLDNQKEVLRLALLNTNARGAKILREEIRGRLESIVAFLDRAASASASAGTPGDADAGLGAALTGDRTAAVAHRIMYQVVQLVELLAQHLDATTETEMNLLDQQIAAAGKGAEDGLLQLKGLLDETARGEFGPVLADLQAVRKAATQVQELSHTNSNVQSTQLTLTKTFEVASKCDSALERLIQALGKRMGDQKLAAQRAYVVAVATTAGAGALGTVIALILAVFVTRMITRPMAQGVEVAGAIARGDLTQRLHLEQRDEVGRLACAMDKAAETFSEIVSEISDVSGQIGTSATDLTSVSHQLVAQSEEMSIQAGNVAGGTEQMTANIGAMAAAAEEMSMNVASISSASEEISVNVASISAAAEAAARNVETVVGAVQASTQSFTLIADDARQGAHTTAEAVRMANDANTTINALDRSATEISKATEMIKLIAMQTNLLALNATIEATSAGEAGRGFAVVANEIKELAHQSAKAAEDIARMVEGIQGSTREAVAVIERVSGTISAVNSSSDRISRAVESQTRAAAESVGNLTAASQGVGHIATSIAEVAKGATDMARNCGEAAKAANDVSHNAAEAARAVRDISANIHGVSDASKGNAASAHQISTAAGQLQAIAGELQKIVGQFTLAPPSRNQAARPTPTSG